MTHYKVYLKNREKAVYEGGTMRDCILWIIDTFGPEYNMGDMFLDGMSIEPAREV